MMQIFELQSNEGRVYVRSTPKRLRAAMKEYIRAKREAGWTPSMIIFCWSPIRISRTI